MEFTPEYSDEIIISDDGSSDATLAYVDELISAMKIEGTSVEILKDNPRHGYCGNFEWALKHTTGDYIFLSDQDDVWHPEKVKKVMECFKIESKAKMVFHDTWLIDKEGMLLEGNIIENFSNKYIYKIEKKEFLERTVSHLVVNGMLMCISKELLHKSLAFPQTYGLHDKWLLFCAVMMDSCYYLNEKLSYYRLHGENVSGSKLYKGTILNRMKKIKKRANKNWKEQNEFIVLGKAMKDKMIENNDIDTEAYRTALRVCEIGEKLQDSFAGNRIVGVFKLCKLFITDIRYRRSGVQQFLYQLVSILLK